MLKSKGRHVNRHRHWRQREFDELRGEKFKKRPDDGRKQRQRKSARNAIAEASDEIRWAIRRRFKNALRAMNIKEAAWRLRKHIGHSLRVITETLRQMVDQDVVFETRMGYEFVYSVNPGAVRLRS